MEGPYFFLPKPNQCELELYDSVWQKVGLLLGNYPAREGRVIATFFPSVN
jgi:hypothetical protein